MDITVVLCTYNRCEVLARALQSVAASSIPGSVEWEVLVVDNGSTDGTPAVAHQLSAKYPGRFRYLLESQPGKSRALNAGVREARGRVVAFVDDDVTVESEWLRTLTATLASGEWAGAGGRTLPPRDFPRPHWLPVEGQYALAPLAIFDRGSREGALNEAPFGNNMAYRKEVFEKYGGFRVDLGPRPNHPGPQKSEDSEFGCRLLAAGERLRYEPSAIVYHEVPENRVTKKYFLDWWFDKARADVRAFGISADTSPPAAGVPLLLFRRLLVWTLRWLVTLDPRRRFASRLKVSALAGQSLERYRLARELRQAKACKYPAQDPATSFDRPTTGRSPAGWE